jgi:hypothetical protein
MHQECEEVVRCKKYFLDICRACVDAWFVTDAPDPSALPDNPDPAADQAALRAEAQIRAGGVLSLLRKLIDYGQQLARTVQERTAARAIFLVAVNFGTGDMALILARITRGLRLAQALETRLAKRPVRLEVSATSARAPAERAKRTARRTEPRPSLPLVPTAEEIAAALRHRPAAAVISEICRDLGITPSHPLWGEIIDVVSEHGGNFVKLFVDAMDRVSIWFTAPCEIGAEGWPVLLSEPAGTGGTGPP